MYYDSKVESYLIWSTKKNYQQQSRWQRIRKYPTPEEPGSGWEKQVGRGERRREKRRNLCTQIPQITNPKMKDLILWAGPFKLLLLWGPGGTAIKRLWFINNCATNLSTAVLTAKTKKLSKKGSEEVNVSNVVTGEKQKRQRKKERNKGKDGEEGKSRKECVAPPDRASQAIHYSLSASPCQLYYCRPWLTATSGGRKMAAKYCWEPWEKSREGLWWMGVFDPNGVEGRDGSLPAETGSRQNPCPSAQNISALSAWEAFRQTASVSASITRVKTDSLHIQQIKPDLVWWEYWSIARPSAEFVTAW